MPSFIYKAADSHGKVIRGTMDAALEKDVVARLHGMNLIPMRVVSSKEDATGLGFNRSVDLSHLFQRVTSRDVMYFTQDLCAMLEAGLPMDKALSILIHVSENDRFRQIVTGILRHVESGNSLSDALTEYPKHFSRLYVNMVRAGETGGVLPSVLERLGVFLENSQDLKDYITSAMVYPIFLVLVGGVSIIIMLTFVIPKFSIIFADMGQAMPASTQILLAISNGLRDYWWVIIGIIAAISVMVRQYIRTPAGRLRSDRLKFRAPVLGRLVKSVEAARFSRTLGTLIRSGVPILQSLSLVREIVTNQAIAASLKIVYERVKEGDTLSSPLDQAGVFPPLAVQMIAVGEETGKLDDMLLKVADNYDKSVRNMIKRFVNLLEPAMILAMGLMVGFIVISMLMAVFSMNEVPF